MGAASPALPATAAKASFLSRLRGRPVAVPSPVLVPPAADGRRHVGDRQLHGQRHLDRRSRDGHCRAPVPPADPLADTVATVAPVLKAPAGSRRAAC